VGIIQQHNDMHKKIAMENGFLIKCDRDGGNKVGLNLMNVLLAVILSAFRRQQAATAESMLIPTLATA
jgi:hypothetical protein